MNDQTVRVNIVDSQSGEVVHSWETEKINEVRVIVYLKDQVIENVEKIEIIRGKKDEEEFQMLEKKKIENIERD